MFNFAPIRSIAIYAAMLIGATVSVSALAEHSWNKYHWARTTAPFQLQLGDNLTSDWDIHLAIAFNDWNNPTNTSSTTPILTAIVAGGAKRRCSMVKGTTQVCNGKYGNNGWLGLATIYVSGDHITQGSAKMNDTYLSTATKYNNPNERQHVMCQEIAHTFGLDHQSTDGSSLNTCMDYFSNTGVNATSTLSISPNTHDFDELNIIYKHLDSTTTVASGAASAASTTPDPSDDPINWGYLMRQSPDGRSSIYEQFNRDGSRTLTHVYWTEEAASACPTCDHRVYR